MKLFTPPYQLMFVLLTVPWVPIFNLIVTQAQRMLPFPALNDRFVAPF